MASWEMHSHRIEQVAGPGFKQPESVLAERFSDKEILKLSFVAARPTE